MVTSLSANTVEQNKAKVIEYHDIWRSGDVNSLGSIISPNFKANFSGGLVVEGIEAVKGFITQFRVAFPDWKENIKTIIGEGEYISVHYFSTGTHRAEFCGVGPTNNKIAINELSLYRLEFGKIVEQIVHPDESTMWKQIRGEITA